MSAHRYRATWRSLLFNGVHDDTGLVDDPAHVGQGAQASYANSDYRLESLDMTRVQVSDYRELRQFLEGSDSNEAFEGYRLLTGRGTIIGATPADLEDRTWAMNEAFSPAACRMAFQSNTPPGTGPFDFKRASASGAKALRFFCRPGTGRPVIIGRAREGLSRRFLFVLVALDPFAYDQTLTNTVITGGGTVVNAGNVHTRPTIAIVTSAAGAANFTLTNTTTGQSVIIDLSANGANTFTLDTSRCTITVTGGTSVIGRVTGGFLSNLWLPVGSSSWTVANATNVTSVTVSHRNAYA